MKQLTAKQLEKVRKSICVLISIAASAAFCGWLFDIPILKTALPGLTTMKSNTAICFQIMAGVYLFLPRARTAGLCGSAVVCVISTMTLVEYLFGVRLALDEALFADPATTSLPFPGRMSPATAIAFAAIGIGTLFLVRGRSRAALVLGHALSLVPGGVGYLSLVGYVYGVERLYNFGPYVSVAVHTAVCFLLISGVMLLTRNREGWTYGFRSRPIATAVLVRLIGISLFLPFATGLITELGGRLGYYQPLFGPAIFAMLASMAFIWMALTAAHTVRGAEDALVDAREDAQTKTRALAASDERYQFVVDNLAELVWQADIDGRILFVNRQWLDFTGLSFEEFEVRGWSRSVHPNDLDRTLTHWRGAIARRHAYSIEYRLRHHTGVYRWFKAVGSTTLDTFDGKEYWIGSLTDVQAIVEAREILARSQEDLERLVEERTANLKIVEESLRQSQKMEAIGKLTGGVAHDFNNFLTVIKSSTDLLKRPTLSEERRTRYVGAISDTVDRAAKLTAQLLAFARRQPLNPDIVDIGQNVGAIGEMIGTLMGSQIRVVIVQPEKPCVAKVDTSQFDTAIVNMASNARDAMDGNGVLSISVRAVPGIPDRPNHPAPVGGFVAVSVTDTGRGIAKEHLDHIFEPFFTTKGVGHGTGLGLSQVFGFAKQSGGDVLVESETAYGTTFTLFLPRSAASGFIKMAEEPKPLPDGHGTRVLIVEDNAEVGAFASQTLSELGYQATLTCNAQEALEVLETTAGFDVVFSDVVMPGMNGVELATEIRRRHAGLPVVLTSGYSHVLTSNNTKDFDLLQKPYSVEALSRSLRAAVLRPS